MLPINLLQSQLAHNKKRINELQERIQYAVQDLKGICINIKAENFCTNMHNQRWVECLHTDKQRTLKEIQTTRKQLKQLAILQKAIKTSISLQAIEEAYLDAEYNNIGV